MEKALPTTTFVFRLLRSFCWQRRAKKGALFDFHFGRQ